MATFKPEACQLIGIGPVSPVPDVEAAVAYYRDQLGFDRDFVEGEPPDPAPSRAAASGFSSPCLKSLFSRTSIPGGSTYLLMTLITSRHRTSSGG